MHLARLKHKKKKEKKSCRKGLARGPSLLPRQLQAMEHGPKAKHWLFVYPNPEHYLEHLSNENSVEYAVWQLEIAPTTGTPHYQGYIIFWTPKRMSQVKKILKINSEVLVCKGSPDQNRTYCTKLDTRIGDFSEIGTFPGKGQGKRSDLAGLHSALKTGLQQHEYVDQFFSIWASHPHLVTYYEAAQSRPRNYDTPTKCILLLGIPRAGKSTLARLLAGRESERLGQHGIFFNKQPGKWWDGYRRELVVVFEDFRGNSLSFTDFKLSVDRLPLRVEIKGTYCHLEATTFIITSNYKTDDWWSKDVVGEAQEAINGRVTEVYFFPEKYKYYHFTSYQDYHHNITTPRFENDLFVIQKELQTLQEEPGTLQAQEGEAQLPQPRYAENQDNALAYS